MSTLSRPSLLHRPRPKRTAAIACGVIALHAGALWALQAGLVRNVTEIVLPVEIVSRLVTPPQPAATPPAPSPSPAPPGTQLRPRPAPAPKPAPRPAPAPAPAPQPAAIADPRPAPAATTGVLAPAPATPIAAPVTAGPAAPAPPAPAAPPPPRPELPSSDAAYLQDPPPVYPAMSRRLGEQGKVVVRVLIGADGQPQRAEVKRGSGFPRLDQAALDYVMRSRYLPGKVGGVPQAMWYEAPVNFVLG
jgi:protein TonB